MSEPLILRVTEFTGTPGPRKRIQGDFSGQQFLEEYLLPRFDEAVRLGVKLIVHLDGTEGYATSFLEEAFGGLARKRRGSRPLEILDIRSVEEPYLLKPIERYIRAAG